MANTTAIEWTDLTWNPVHGCSKVSPGCAHCYAAELSLRRKLTKKPWTPANAAENVTVKPHKLREPLSKAKEWQGLGAAAAAAGKTDGKLVFVNSTSDLFHEQVPDDFIAWTFAVMAFAQQHTFQVLTKRPDRMRELLTSREWAVRLMPKALVDVPMNFASASHYRQLALDGITWPLPNVWLGTSIENRRFVHRADLLRETPAAVRFISAEPLLGPLIYDKEFPDGAGWADGADPLRFPELHLTGIDWLIVGGESGPGHRPMRVEWVRALLDAALETRPGWQAWSDPDAAPAPAPAVESGTAFFFKQWGGRTPRAGGRLLDGRTWDEIPEVA